MGQKLSICGDKSTVGEIYVALEKEEGIPTCSELFLLISLACKFLFMASQPLKLIFCCRQLFFHFFQSTYPSPCQYFSAFNSFLYSLIYIRLYLLNIIIIVEIIFSFSLSLFILFSLSWSYSPIFLYLLWFSFPQIFASFRFLFFSLMKLSSSCSSYGCLLLISSPCRDCLLLVSLSLLDFFLPIHIYLVNITFLILYMIIFSLSSLKKNSPCIFYLS